MNREELELAVRLSLFPPNPETDIESLIDWYSLIILDPLVNEARAVLLEELMNLAGMPDSTQIPIDLIEAVAVYGIRGALESGFATLSSLSELSRCPTALRIVHSRVVEDLVDND